MSSKESPSVTRARSLLLKCEVLAPEDALPLAEDLKRQLKFGYARKILEATRARYPASPESLRLAQQHALCTYKDPDQPTYVRLERAGAILREADDPETSRDQETLGLAGAIEKRIWEVNSHPRHLERALVFFRRAAAEGIEMDRGYTALNAAYVHDLLASQARDNATSQDTDPASYEYHAKEARRLREEIVRIVTPLREGLPELDADWWFLATLAEAHLGLGNYAEAKQWVERAVALPAVPDWQRESTGRQLARLALLRREAGPPVAEDGHPEEVIRVLLQRDGDVLDSLLLGKVGLALSGGGFRASLFHIGVLARLAELDVLRHVEVLSCVSGGSIIGTHYYLEVRRLLESKPDSEITRDDYVRLVQRVAEDFLAGVKRNVRMRVAAEFTTNLKMILPNYSRTQRAGELYEREIYSRVEDGLGKAPRYMDQLLIRPAGTGESFDPKRENWLRRAKVPILVLNATSLNTGHVWQFTATWMGEPPATIASDVDGNYRLRRMYYHQAPERHRRVRVGHAVAASACVPGLFEPLALPDLYPDPIPGDPEPAQLVVRLVDGGVHDNQGISSLLEQECGTILVSDASGQMGSQDVPGSGPLSVPMRSNNILMARVREEQFRSLESRLRGSLLRRFVFLHLKKGLPLEPVDWLHCQEPYRFFGDPRPSATGDETDYGVPHAVQKRLAAMRTDLDSFSDLEAFALMASGYRMTDREVELSLTDFPLSDAPRAEWPFRQVEYLWAGATESSDGPAGELLRVIDVGGSRFLKVWRLVPWLRFLAGLLLLMATAGAVWSYFAFGSRPVGTTVGAILITGGVLVAGAILGPIVKRMLRAFRYEVALRRVALGVVMALVGWLVARVHLHLFDRLYLWWGSEGRMLPPHRDGWLRFTSILGNDRGTPAAEANAATVATNGKKEG